jgi:uncharacterized protein YcnI
MPAQTTRPTDAQPRRQRALRRASLTTAVLTALVLIPLGAAQAHVTVHPDTTTAGAESAEMTFRVPTESDSASTVSVELHLPTTNPLAEVLARPMTGWTIKVTDGKLPKPVVVDGTTLTEGPTTVIWTATAADAQVKPGQYQDFTIEGGPLPKSGDVIFTATQTYSDGSVVNWNQPQLAGQDEPEHPAPSFTVTPASANAADGHTADTALPAATSTTTHPASGTDPTARWLGGVGLGLGVVALALVGLRQRRNRAGQS